MQINVIGGSGFIGTRLAERLIDHNHSVKIFDIEKSSTFPELCTYADVRDKYSLRNRIDNDSAIVNLAAVHKDDVKPKSLYDEVNVEGAKNICYLAEELGTKTMVFTSSVAVYGFAPGETDEGGSLDPFNDYGRTKMLAESVFRSWQEKGKDKRCLVIVRPTVVFGEGNRGNVYNLMKQIQSGRFIMIGKGKNIKSMAYVENVAAFLESVLTLTPGIHVFNYVDKPDYDMKTLVSFIRNASLKSAAKTRVMPYWIGYAGGLFFDILSFLTRRSFSVSSIRIKKFCSNSYFSSNTSGFSFTPPVPISEGLKKTLEFEFKNLEHRKQVGL